MKGKGTLSKRKTTVREAKSWSNTVFNYIVQFDHVDTLYVRSVLSCLSVLWVGLSGRVPAVMYKVPDPCRR